MSGPHVPELILARLRDGPGLQYPLGGGLRRPFIAFDVFRSDPLLREQPHGRREEVPDQPLQGVDPVHQRDEALVIDPPVAVEPPDLHAVLLLDMGVVVLAVAARARPRGGGQEAGQVPADVRVDELPAVVRVEHDDVERRAPAAPLFHTLRSSVHAVATSVAVSVHTKLPAIEPPQWATVSTST